MNRSIEALRNREGAAWETFYEELAHDMYGFVYRLLGRDRQAAEDVFQSVWMEAIDRIDQFDPDRGEPRQWLFGIARQQVALAWRRKLSSSGHRMWDSSAADESIDEDILPEEVIEQMEQAEVVRAALLALPPHSRDVLTEKYIKGLAVQQIAEKTGRSHKAVESQLSRSRAQLRSLLRWYFSQNTEANRHDE